MARSHDTGHFCHGDAPILADCCLVPQVANALRFDCPLDDDPTVWRIVATCQALPAFQQAHPSRQPDAEQAGSGIQAEVAAPVDSMRST